MRILLKIIAVPVMLVLSLLNALLSFLCSVASWLCGVLCLLFLVCGLFSCFIQGDATAGVRELIGAFLLSPFAIPALAWWIIDRLGDLSASLHSFVVS